MNRSFVSALYRFTVVGMLMTLVGTIVTPTPGS